MPERRELPHDGKVCLSLGQKDRDGVAGLERRALAILALPDATEPGDCVEYRNEKALIGRPGAVDRIGRYVHPVYGSRVEQDTMHESNARRAYTRPRRADNERSPAPLFEFTEQKAGEPRIVEEAQDFLPPSGFGFRSASNCGLADGR